MARAANGAHDHDHRQCIDEALTKAAELCARRGARLTDLRRRVLELVWQDHAAVKAYDVLERLGDTGGRSAGAAKPPTVYRALDFLMAHGLVHRIESLNAYIGCRHPEESHAGRFLICDGCGEVAEFESAAIRRAIAEQAEQLDFAARHETVEVHGLCRRCQSPAAAP